MSAPRSREPGPPGRSGEIPRSEKRLQVSYRSRHTLVLTSIQCTYIKTYIQYKCTYMHTYMHSCYSYCGFPEIFIHINCFIHTCILVYIHTSIHTLKYEHTYIHTHTLKEHFYHCYLCTDSYEMIEVVDAAYDINLSMTEGGFEELRG